MRTPHYRLTDGPLLRRLMRCPDMGGQRHTVRSLAREAGLGKSKIGYMLAGRQMTVTGEQADRIARAVGVNRKAIFLPTASTSTDTDAREEDHA